VNLSPSLDELKLILKVLATFSKQLVALQIFIDGDPYEIISYYDYDDLIVERSEKLFYEDDDDYNNSYYSYPKLKYFRRSQISNLLAFLNYGGNFPHLEHLTLHL